MFIARTNDTVAVVYADHLMRITRRFEAAPTPIPLGAMLIHAAGSMSTSLLPPCDSIANSPMLSAGSVSEGPPRLPGLGCAVRLPSKPESYCAVLLVASFRGALLLGAA